MVWRPWLGVVPRAAGAPAAEATTAQTDASVPARDVTMIGSSPGEAAGETWGLGQHEGQSTLVEYTSANGWTDGPALLSAAGEPLSTFELDHPEAARYPYPSPLAGAMTNDGSGVLAGTVTSGSTLEQVILVRNPGGAFREVPALGVGEGSPTLAEGEHLFSLNRAPMVAALEEAPGSGGERVHAGALVVPVDEDSNVESRVLHWNGASWSSEPIEVPAESSSEFHVVAVAASSPENAWLVGRLASSYPGGSNQVALFRRVLSGGEARWRPVAVQPGGEAGAPLTVPLEGRAASDTFVVPEGFQSQVLAVTAEGVWVDGVRTSIGAGATIYFKPSEELAGTITGGWCAIPESAPAGTLSCERSLPKQLTAARIRSYAWSAPSNPSGYGERVITGLSEGISLRLSGGEFTEVRALGGSPAPQDVGGTFGSAFTTPTEGWLGNYGLPVHIEPTGHAAASELRSWPTAFSRALLAVAPAPGQPVGSISSEALAVGDDGEVARFKQGQGWVPESLFGPGQHHETVRLRAVAWPTPERAYAVGDFKSDSQSQMWMWRGETDLWEPDPATPENFTGNLLGVAFESGNGDRGYAVGQGGVLLSYGKTWTQEEALPEGVSGPHVAFTSVAFAGSEAIVAYRKLIPSTERYEGGLIVNGGQGWHIDAGAATALAAYGHDDAPWAVAALPDGGAAFSTDDGQIFERQAAGGQWQLSSTPYPGESSPESLSVFREGGALRVVAVGAISLHELAETEDQAAPPPGSPPNYIPAYPISTSEEQGVLRQTATGWSDEQHELNNVEEPEGEYAQYDTVYQPDPVSAVLVGPEGSQGWAVGGIVDSGNPHMDTADVWRYRPGSETPEGVAAATIPTEAGEATFAIGGGARCEAPCAARANARIGPDVWLDHAIETAATRIPGIRAFFYTGPRVTTGRTAGPATVPVPYGYELERYAQVLDPDSLPVYPAATTSDLDAGENEAGFESAFSGFPQPLGTAPAAGGLASAGRAGGGCGGSPGSEVSYYALESTSPGHGGPVRMIVLDDSEATVAPNRAAQGQINSAELCWLGEELAGAYGAGEPAIVVGNSDLQAQVAGGEGRQRAEETIEALVRGHASAYFFDAPEQNITAPLSTASTRAAGLAAVASYGSGTLGYESFTAQEQSDFLGPSGFLLVQVGARNPTTRQFSVSVRTVPNIGELALEAVQGPLLRRSEVAQFQALARRPRAGNDAAKGSVTPLTDPYIPIPFNCVGVRCEENASLAPEYSFTSSNPTVGNFVKPDLAVSDTTVEEGKEGKPIADSQSGLFCAFNAGETTVTVTAGGLSSSTVVRVQPGSVRQPCGTVKTQAKPETVTESAPPPSPQPQAHPESTPPTEAAPIPPPAPPAAVVPKVPKPTPLTPFLTPQPPVAFVPAFVPLPVPSPARPTPPSGTSAVTSPVEAPEKEEEEEAAPESVSNEAVAYRHTEHEPAPVYLLGLIVLAAFAGATVRRRPGRGRRDVRIAPATLSSMRSQQRLGDLTRGRRRR
jgi:hypothetical protein